MSESYAGEERQNGAAVEPPAAPADEQVAWVRRRSLTSVVRAGGLWVLLLFGVWYLQRTGLQWSLPSGGMRLVLHLGILLAAFAAGLRAGGRDDFPWTQWPPEGTLLHRRTRFVAADLAHGWWRVLWLLPFLTVSFTIMSGMAALALTRSGGVTNIAHAATLLWHGVLAAAAGNLVGRIILRPGAEAITTRGVHPSPVSFVSWGALSHAIAEPEEAVIRLYPRSRPWIPRCVLTYPTSEAAREAADLIAEEIPCVQPEGQPAADRVCWGAFLGGTVAACVLLTGMAFRLLLLPAAPVMATGALPLIHILSMLVGRMPEVVPMLALLAGVFLDIALDELRGITTKRIVSEDR